MENFYTTALIQWSQKEEILRVQKNTCLGGNILGVPYMPNISSNR